MVFGLLFCLIGCFLCLLWVFVTRLLSVIANLWLGLIWLGFAVSLLGWCGYLDCLVVWIACNMSLDVWWIVVSFAVGGLIC